MGVDISACSGVAVAATTLANIVTEENKELACRTLIRYATTMLHTLKDDMSDGELDEWDRRSKQSMARFLLSAFESLSIESSVEDVQQTLVKMAPGREDGFHSHVENSEEALEVWGELIGSLFPEAPKPDGTLCIGSARYQGNWDLPQGEAMFVFSEDECFERVKTEAGKRLDSMLGKTTELAEWTNYSC